MYGHIRTMALEVKKGLEAAGSKVTLLRVADEHERKGTLNLEPRLKSGYAYSQRSPCVT